MLPQITNYFCKFVKDIQFIYYAGHFKQIRPCP